MSASSLKALVIESDIIRAKQISSLLESSVEPVISCERAGALSHGYNLYEEDTWDVVITSLKLCDASGLQALVRFQEARKNVPVIAILEDETHEAIVDAARSLADDCLFWGNIGVDSLRRSVVYAMDRLEMLEELRGQQSQAVPVERDLSCKELMNRLDDALFLVSREDGGILFVNEVAEKWFGANICEAVSDALEYDLLDVEEAEMEVPTRNSAIPSARLRSVHIDWRGKPACMITLRDISKQKQAEEAFLGSQRRLGHTLKASNLGLWSWDLRKNQLRFSDRWKAILGYSGKEFTDTLGTFKKALHPDDRDHVVGVFKSYLRCPRANFKLEYRMKHKNGNYLRLLCRAELVSDSQGRLSKMIGSLIESSQKPTESTSKPKSTNDAGVADKAGAAPRRKALIVDDEEVLRTVLHSILNTHGFDTIIAKDGLEAIKLYEENKDEISLAMLDMNMPCLDGGKVYERIRKDGQGIPILVMSGNDDREALPFQHSATENSDFLMKPFGMKDIKQSIERLMGKSVEALASVEGSTA